METKNMYTISAYTENSIGLLNRISGIFQRRHINVESINSSKSELKNITRLTLVVEVTETQVKKIIGQIEKQVEVIKAFYHSESDTIYQESCLFKLNPQLLMGNHDVQSIINNSTSRVINISEDFVVLEKSGSKEEVESLYESLGKYGIMQFVRSGRIAVTKEEMKISNLLVENTKRNEQELF